jgi:hypothetical protein
MSKSEAWAMVESASYFVILSSLLDILRFAFSFTFGRNKHDKIFARFKDLYH